MIKIFNVYPVHKGDLLASCSVKIEPWKMKIHKVMVFQKGLQRWVNLPREKYETNGETKYNDLIEFDDPGATKRFRDQVLAAVDEYIQVNGDMTPEDVVKADAPFPF